MLIQKKKNIRNKKDFYEIKNIDVIKINQSTLTTLIKSKYSFIVKKN